MISKPNILTIQVPAHRAGPRNAARIGEFTACLLARARTAGAALVGAMTAAGPRTIRAELQASAAGIEAQRPAAALSLRSVAAKGWVH